MFLGMDVCFTNQPYYKPSRDRHYRSSVELFTTAACDGRKNLILGGFGQHKPNVLIEYPGTKLFLNSVPSNRLYLGLIETFLPSEEQLV